MKFVILDHHPPKTNEPSAARTEDRHFDLLFEVADQEELISFAASKLPGRPGQPDQDCSIEVTRLSDHRIAYLNYEGPVSNNRGVVERHAFGIWSGELDSEALLVFDTGSANFRGESWTIRFDSDQLFRIA